MNRYIKKDEGQKILKSPVLNKILKVWGTLFELINKEVKCSKNYFITFLQKEAGTGAFRNNTGKEPQKPRQKLKNIYIIYLLRIFALPATQWKW